MADGDGRWGVRHTVYNWPQCRYCGGADNNGRDHNPGTCMACGTVQCARRSECAVCLYGRIPGFYYSAGKPVCGYAGCGKDAVAKAPRVKWVCKDHLDRPTLSGYGQPKIPLSLYIAERVADRDGPRRMPYTRTVKFVWMPGR